MKSATKHKDKLYHCALSSSHYFEKVITDYCISFPITVGSCVFIFPPRSFQDKYITNIGLQNPECEKKKMPELLKHRIYNSFPLLSPRKYSLSIQWLPIRLVAVSRFSTERRQRMVCEARRCLMVADLEVLCKQFHCCCAMVQKIESQVSRE